MFSEKNIQDASFGTVRPLLAWRSAFVSIAFVDQRLYRAIRAMIKVVLAQSEMVQPASG
jgi:hypothetical protein